jgi:uracil-DNA glycosylase
MYNTGMTSWMDFFNSLKTDLNYLSLMDSIEALYKEKVVYPSKEFIFEAFKLTPLETLKVVIIGQDPYHQKGQAHGLAFSVLPGIKAPPSLKNIFKEIQNDIGEPMNFQNGHLNYLSIQGVLLLNTLLTVEEGKPLSHQGIGYEGLIEQCFAFMDTLPQPIVFLLWGDRAKKYQRFIHNPNRLILTAHHPSPLSANRGGWFGCKHFSKTNDYLESKGFTKIYWKNS